MTSIGLHCTGVIDWVNKNSWPPPDNSKQGQDTISVNAQANATKQELDVKAGPVNVDLKHGGASAGDTDEKGTHF